MPGIYVASNQVDLAEKFLITRAFCHSLLINRSMV